MECFKIIARDKKTGRQYKKWEYISKAKFDKYSSEVLRRYEKPFWNGDEYSLEIYKTNDGELWERVNERT